MNEILQELLNLLDLERIEENLFRGGSLDLGGISVFGGQVLGQALVAAGRTVAGRRAHSLHAYFLRPGDMTAPIVYDVDRIRDGRSFSTRRIVAIQHGEPIFTMAASFQIDEGGLEHQTPMPDVPGPEGLPSLVDLRRKMAELDPERFGFGQKGLRELPIEIRPVEPANPYKLGRQPPAQKIWFRAVGRIPDDPGLHQAVLAYASDFGLLRTASLTHEISFRQKNVHAASIDHAMWFHRDFRADQWLLYVTESPSASGSRGFALGNIFSRDGTLVASVAQEGLMRVG
ncbi:acyl-CoA thioesterase II [Geobacter sp.]|uniref:acyl-CoA thioesterase II n=1 Tax=Geobacter sp. TaxID=46610 RepID=UPI0026025008|nr:acyl-CoA thioesterase II [Geobacter sp.]